MIEIKELPDYEPYQLFLIDYEKALKNNQKNVEAACISTFNIRTNEVEARFVNIKYIKKDEWIFFSNYNSPKSQCFQHHNQVAAVFYWSSTNTQIRIKAIIEKSSSSLSDNHFNQRLAEKNAIAISSNQSEKIESYKKVVSNYENVLNNTNSLKNRPEYWGGYSFVPYYFEFWYGHHSRINERLSFSLNKGLWKKEILQP